MRSNRAKTEGKILDLFAGIGRMALASDVVLFNAVAVPTIRLFQRHRGLSVAFRAGRHDNNIPS